MKMLQALKQQIENLGELERVWFATFNISINFVETCLLPTILRMDTPRNRMDYESFQQEIQQQKLDLRIFCDRRAMEPDQYKRTCINIYPVSPRASWNMDGVTDDTLFHPKVIYIEDKQGNMVLGAGSANLTVSGWGRNQEVFSFKTVSNHEQYKQIQSFFNTLWSFVSPPDRTEETLPNRRRITGPDIDWSFIHSFQNQAFLAQLLANNFNEQITVWSPYLSDNLPALVTRLQEEANNPAMRIGLVPDRIEGRYIRTLWSKELETLIANGTLTFFENPTRRHENTEITHAKVWLASGKRKHRLAIGSWNFTHSGTSSFESRNIEAGILTEIGGNPQITGKTIAVTSDDFASHEQLQDDRLELPDDLPFDLHVLYNWQTAIFTILGKSEKKLSAASYFIKLPGLKKPLELCWKSNRKDRFYPLETINVCVPDNEALLSNHNYIIEHNGNAIHQGMILESCQSYRRAQGYETLKDLLDSLVNQADTSTNDNLMLRHSHSLTSGPDESYVLPARNEAPDSLSYFRLFHAIEQFRQRLLATDTVELLEKWLFVHPGCLQELASKAREHVMQNPPSVFSWFLAHEVNSLSRLAHKQYRALRDVDIPRSPAPGLWSTLSTPSPDLPMEVAQHQEYVQRIVRECGYAQ